MSDERRAIINAIKQTIQDSGIAVTPGGWIPKELMAECLRVAFECATNDTVYGWALNDDGIAKQIYPYIEAAVDELQPAANWSD